MSPDALAAGGSASWFANRKTTTKVMMGVLPPLALLVALDSAALWNVNKMNETSGWADHTLVVLSKASGIVASAVDMETGLRGFLLAGDRVFPEPYEAGAERFAALVAELAETVDDNPAHVARLETARDTVAHWKNEIVAPLINLRASIAGARTMDDMADLVGEARGKQYFDGFRENMAAFEAEEQALIAEQRAKNVATRSQTFTVILGGIVVALILGLGAAWLVGASIGGPVRRITVAMRRLSDSDTGVTIDGEARRHAVADMARATDVYNRNEIENACLNADRRRPPTASARRRPTARRSRRRSPNWSAPPRPATSRPASTPGSATRR